MLEVDPTAAKNVNLMVRPQHRPVEKEPPAVAPEKPVSDMFVDDPDVPPLI